MRRVGCDEFGWMDEMVEMRYRKEVTLPPKNSKRTSIPYQSSSLRGTLSILGSETFFSHLPALIII